MFESFLDMLLEQYDAREYVTTMSLEFLNNLERVMQYLFSGNERKLGNREILIESALLTNLEMRNFPRFPKDFYNFAPEKLEIRLDKWPKSENGTYLLNCASTFTSTKIRKLSLNIEIELKVCNGAKSAPYLFWEAIHELAGEVYNPLLPSEFRFTSYSCKAQLLKDARFTEAKSMTIMTWLEIYTNLILSREVTIDSDISGLRILKHIMISNFSQYIRFKAVEDGKNFFITETAKAVSCTGSPIWLPQVSDRKFLFYKLQSLASLIRSKL
jgi:hypothetical protein